MPELYSFLVLSAARRNEIVARKRSQGRGLSAGFRANYRRFLQQSLFKKAEPSLVSAGLTGVEKTVKKPALILRGPPEDPGVKSVAEFLGRVGLDYVSETGRERMGQLLWGADVLKDLSHQKLVEFLWAHGAKLEDS